MKEINVEFSPNGILGRVLDRDRIVYPGVFVGLPFDVHMPRGVPVYGPDLVDLIPDMRVSPRAPDLYTALQDMLERAEEHLPRDSWTIPAFDAARAALAEAPGATASRPRPFPVDCTPPPALDPLFQSRPPYVPDCAYCGRPWLGHRPPTMLCPVPRLQQYMAALTEGSF